MTAGKHLSELIEVVDLFIELEISLEQYYDLCAKIFPDEKFAWFGIATQEGIHVKIFKKIKESIMQNPEKWSLGKYNFGVLKTTINLIHQELHKIRNKDYNSKFVVTFAKDIESSLVESDIANAFVSDTNEYRMMVKKILEETDEHKEFITRFLESREFI